MEENTMSETRYTTDHEWARSEEDGIATIGITEFAQEQLGDIVFVDLPETGSIFDAGEEIAVIESVKAAADLKTPLTGEIVEVNEELADSPELVNESPTDEGWFCKIQMSESSEFDALMDEQQYEDYTSNLE
jgi:glycine cleavage system H protein